MRAVKRGLHGGKAFWGEGKMDLHVVPFGEGL